MVSWTHSSSHFPTHLPEGLSALPSMHFLGDPAPCISTFHVSEGLSRLPVTASHPGTPCHTPKPSQHHTQLHIHTIRPSHSAAQSHSHTQPHCRRHLTALQAHAPPTFARPLGSPVKLVPGWTKEACGERWESTKKGEEIYEALLSAALSEAMVDLSLFDTNGHMLCGRSGVELWMSGSGALSIRFLVRRWLSPQRLSFYRLVSWWAWHR